jgi:hypothetical protein
VLVAGRVRRQTRIVILLGGLGLVLAHAGCAFGPRALERTHGRYAESIRQVHEEQFLRNIVRLRYNESLVALNVSSIAAQYELSGTAEARPFFLSPNPSNSNVIFRTFTAILPDVTTGASNRPTISLVPADDNDVIRQFLTPIPADTLVFLAQTTWPVSTIFRLWVERLNGVPNAVQASGPPRDVVPDFARFFRVTELLQDAQDRELISLHAENRPTEVGGPLAAAAVTAAAVVEAAKNGLEYWPRADGKSWVLVRPERRLVLDVHPGAEASPELTEFARLLNLLPGQRRYDLVVGAGVPDPFRYPGAPLTQLRLEPRSTSQVYFYLANGVEVPPEHLYGGQDRPAVDAEGRVFDRRELTRGLFEVHVCAGHKPPETAYVAVKYRGYWYYVDDRDQETKATMALMLQLSRLNFGRQRSGAGPLLTLPAGR